MIVVAGISDKDAGVASSMFNVGQQFGGALGLAIIGSIAWTRINNHITLATGHLPLGHSAVPAPGTPIYDHALASGVTTAPTISAGAAVVALIVTLLTIRVRKEDLPDSLPVF
jgi:hypothetical protein